MNTVNPFIWNSEVQENELDIQNIVNNAFYLQYFDHTRIQQLLSKGIDWEEWHRNGFNFVLFHVDMAIKQSLKAHDKFYVKSSYEKSGRLKIIFDQTIYKTSNNTLVAKAINTLVCVSVKNGKPVMPEQLLTLLFN
jgi:acyl-CoA thioester hydrolase